MIKSCFWRSMQVKGFEWNHGIIGIISEGVPKLLHSISELINQIALSVFAQVVISLSLLYLHHNFFPVGFVIGFILDSPVREVVNKVNIVISVKRPWLENLFLFGGGGFLAALTLPTSRVIAALYFSSKWGSLLYQKSLESYLQQTNSSTEIRAD